MPDYSKNASDSIPTSGQGMSFVEAGRKKRQQQQAEKDAKAAFSELKKTTKLGRPDTPLAETPEPRRYQ
jgi:hypothetical protein